MSTDPQRQAELLEAVRTAVGGQYAVERLLGQGGMGAVYLGRDLTLQRPVAIKVINPEVAASGTLRDRFLQEARTVARLRHPNIVSVYAAGESNGLLYFAMELVPGESLRELMTREGRLPSARAEQIITEIALALDHAHGHGLVHRDVKPDNILIDAESGRALLTDFGVARVTADESGLTQTGMILGSPRYMSPEQVSGDGTIDGRSDLYSLALVGYELYTGAPVVQSGTIASMIYKHLSETPPPLVGAVPDVPPHVSDAIARGLTKDPAARWQTGRAFAEAIAGGPLSPTGETRRLGGTGAIPRTKRNRGIAIAAGAAVVLAVVAGAVALQGDEPAGNAYLVTPFEIQSGDPSVAWLRQGSVNMLTLTLGQWSDLLVIDYERTLSLLDAEELADKPRLSQQDAFDLARRANAGTVVMGQVQTTRDSLIVVAKLFDVASGKSENQAQAGMAIGGDPRPLFDRLAQHLLNIEGSGRTSTMQLAQATTSSLSAYRAYLDGVRLLNSWQLPEADRELARAIALDSTFALAYHKRSLGLGWSQAGGPDYLGSADRAFKLSDRLPPRERALVAGHYHLAHALAAQQAQDSVAARTGFDASIKSYTDLIGPPRGDSLVAEAWYGLGDAYFHARMPSLPPEAIRRYTTESVRGFHRTLAIDSTYHLAYSHLIQLYNQSGGGSGLIIAADSAILLDSATASRLGAATVSRLRNEASARGLDIARAWTRAEAGSMQPFVQLAQSHGAANQPDSAIRVLRDALASGSRSGAAVARATLLGFEEEVGDSGATQTLRYILDRFTPDSMRQIGIGARFTAEGQLMSSAAKSGRSADVDRAARLFFATDSTLPFSNVSSAPMIEYFRTGLQLAMGDSLTAARRRTLLRSRTSIDSMPPQLRQQARTGTASIPYLAFLASHDTTFQRMALDWSGNELPELEALTALDRSDTATALRIARTFPVPDTLRKARFGFGGMRSVARAEVLERLGLLRQAAETYEATELARINRNGIVEPGLTMWVRTWLARARLWAELGERDRAIAAYEEFIRLWRDADGASKRLVDEATQELAALRDTPAPVGIIRPPDLP
jgi:serine/threonine-protein kinase